MSISDLAAPNLTPEQTELLALLLAEEGLVANETISPRPDTYTPPQLSFAQQRLWFLDQLEPGKATYNISLAFRLHGHLEVIALEQALQTLITRHEILRTTFEVIESQPRQIIHPPAPIQINQVDLSPHRLVEAENLVNDLAHEPFDLAQGPLLRYTLIKLGDSEYILLFVVHHIIYDEWSDEVLFRELSALYNAFIAGQPNPLPAIPLQYADYAIWQQQSLEQKTLISSLNYWREKLTGAPPLLELPTDRPRPAIQRFQGARLTTTLPATLLDPLKTFSQQANATLFMTLLTAFKVMLYRYTQQTDLVVGTPVANRTRAELEPLIGFFVNTLVIRGDLSNQPTFRQLLTQIRQTTLEALEHQDVPFEKVVEALGLARNLSYQPLFQVMFTYENSRLDDLTLTGLQLEPFPVDNHTAKFDLTLTVWESHHQLSLAIEYNTDLFDHSTIERMAGHYNTLLSGIIANPDEYISHLPLLTEAERHQILVEWNDTQADYPRDQCLHELFEAQVERTPDAVAVVMGQLDTTNPAPQLTYRQLNERANQLAHHLQKLGVGPETLVAICVERSLEMVIGLLGILKAGGAYVPLDPTYPPDRLAFMLEDTQAPVLLTQQHLMATLPPHQAQVLCLDSNDFTAESSANVISGVKPDNLVYVIYTSGSTGRPKGAMNTHLAVSNRILWMQETYHLETHDRVLQKTPFSFDVSGWEFHWPLLTGACIVMAQPEGHKDSAYLVNIINKTKITTLHFVPSMLQMFLQNPLVESCVSLKRVICSGEALSYNLQEQFLNRLKSELHNLYGPTEAAIDVSYWPCQPNEQQIVPIGYPISNIQLYILDMYLQPVPIGIVGELYIGGIGVGRGYLNNPTLTQEKFIPDLFHPQTPSFLYKTGDLVRYWSNGAIEYLGRIDHQVKIRGFRIELGEIEEVLRQHPLVYEVIVIARTESHEQPRLIAYLLMGERANDNINENIAHSLRNYLKSKLPDYMIPSAFVVLEEFPLTSNGKIDRKALPAPDSTALPITTKFAPPQSPTEQLLATIWSEVLGVVQVGRHDNFFDLGGHSLLLLQMQAKLTVAFNQSIPVVTLFEYPTIHLLAQYLMTNTTNPILATRSDERHTRQTAMQQQRLARQQHRSKH